MIGKKATNDSDRAGMAFVGCILIGVGLGYLFNQIAVGAILGVGVGFLVMSLIRKK